MTYPGPKPSLSSSSSSCYRLDQRPPFERPSDLLKLSLVILGEVANLLLQPVDVLAQGVLLHPCLLVDLLDLLQVLVVLQPQLVRALRLALVHLLLQLLNQTCTIVNPDIWDEEKKGDFGYRSILSAPLSQPAP